MRGIGKHVFVHHVGRTPSAGPAQIVMTKSGGPCPPYADTRGCHGSLEIVIPDRRDHAKFGRPQPPDTVAGTYRISWLAGVTPMPHETCHEDLP